MLDSSLMKILACPDCKGDLKESNSKLTCIKCKRVYQIKKGIPILLPKQ
ncbi:Trm112p-like protein [Candidatus Tiddalikarchaeum anstoanum]|nr:Trm112p-like protein [Candidatus Tiddalikarchaeum anstoanum]